MIEADLGTGAFALLLILGLCFGMISILVFGRLTDTAAVKAQMRAIAAYLMEFRLFADQPRLILRAQRAVLLSNGRILRAALAPLLVVTLVSTLVLQLGNAVFGRAPLRTGQAAVVTAHFAGAVPADILPDAKLEIPDWIKIDAEPVRVVRANEISWRIKPLLAARGLVRLKWGGQSIEQPIVAGSGIGWIDAGLRWGSASILIQYPPATVLVLSWQTVFFSVAFLGAAISQVILRTGQRLRP